MKMQNETLQFINNYQLSNNNDENNNSKLSSSIEEKIEKSIYRSADSYLEEIKSSIESEQKMNALLSFQNNGLEENVESDKMLSDASKPIKFKLNIIDKDLNSSSIDNFDTNFSSIAKKAQLATAKAIASKFLAKRQTFYQETQTEESGSLEIKLRRIMSELKQTKEFLELKEQSCIELHRQINDKNSEIEFKDRQRARARSTIDSLKREIDNHFATIQGLNSKIVILNGKIDEQRIRNETMLVEYKMMREKAFENEKRNKQLCDYYTSQIYEGANEISEKDKYIKKLDGIIEYIKTIFKTETLEDLEKHIHSYQDLTKELDTANNSSSKLLLDQEAKLSSSSNKGDQEAELDKESNSEVKIDHLNTDEDLSDFNQTIDQNKKIRDIVNKSEIKEDKISKELKKSVSIKSLKSIENEDKDNRSSPQMKSSEVNLKSKNSKSRVSIVISSKSSQKQSITKLKHEKSIVNQVIQASNKPNPMIIDNYNDDSDQSEETENSQKKINLDLDSLTKPLSPPPGVKYHKDNILHQSRIKSRFDHMVRGKQMNQSADLSDLLKPKYTNNDDSDLKPKNLMKLTPISNTFIKKRIQQKCKMQDVAVQTLPCKIEISNEKEDEQIQVYLDDYGFHNYIDHLNTVIKIKSTLEKSKERSYCSSDSTYKLYDHFPYASSKIKSRSNQDLTRTTCTNKKRKRSCNKLKIDIKSLNNNFGRSIDINHIYSLTPDLTNNQNEMHFRVNNSNGGGNMLRQPKF